MLLCWRLSGDAREKMTVFNSNRVLRFPGYLYLWNELDVFANVLNVVEFSSDCNKGKIGGILSCSWHLASP